MTAYRTLAVVAAIGIAPMLVTALAGSPATAHGAPENPASRSAACTAHGAQSSTCKAAIAAGGAQAFEHWDNIRVADVRGRDREVIPDGQLCSAGIKEFSGLDAATASWPTTAMTSGAEFVFRYRGTIPHKGTFRFYVTKDGYDPTQRLTWSALEPQPFLSATDPALEGGSYAIPGRLPAGKSGRHLIYTIWQNSDTPDTYYSCSDVVFKPKSQPPTGDPAKNGTAAGDAGAKPANPGSLAGETVAGAGSSQPASADQRVAKVSQRTGTVSLPAVIAAGFAATAAAGIVGVAILRRRRSQPQPLQREPAPASES